jgi:uncharacterized membrane protein YdbT with pleckstrin-like domain
MAENLVVRPSIKLVIVCYVLTAVVLAAAAWAVYGYALKPPEPWHAIALVLFFFPLKSHLKTRLLTLTVEGDHLTVETGMLSRSRRTVDLAKVQDVTARQSFGQRILGIGDLTLETAGERSQMMIPGIDDPRGVADHILERSRIALRQRTQAI